VPKASRKKKRQPSHKQQLERAVRKAFTRYHRLFRLPEWPIYYKCDVDLVICHEFVHWRVYDLELFLESTLTKRPLRHAKELLESLVEAIALAVVNPSRKKPGLSEYAEKDEEEKDAKH